MLGSCRTAHWTGAVLGKASPLRGVIQASFFHSSRTKANDVIQSDQVCVVIRRAFKPGFLSSEIVDLLRTLKHKAETAPGFFSSAALLSVEDHNTLTTLSNWKNKEAWEDFRTSPDRAAIIARLEEGCTQPTKYDLTRVVSSLRPACPLCGSKDVHPWDLSQFHNTPFEHTGE